MTLDVRVSHLRIGDFLVGSRRRIVSVSALPTVSGKYRVTVSSPFYATVTSSYVWNGSTTVRVERETAIAGVR